MLSIESGDEDLKNIDAEENIDLGHSEIEEAQTQLGSDELIISVSDPIKKLDEKKGIFSKATFVAYKVSTRTTLQQYNKASGNSAMIVRRRFRDFVVRILIPLHLFLTPHQKISSQTLELFVASNYRSYLSS